MCVMNDDWCMDYGNLDYIWGGKIIVQQYLVVVLLVSLVLYSRF